MYHLKPDEIPEKGIKRLGNGLFRDAERRLGKLKDTDKAIHETRKDLKKIRALLRLVRDELGESTYKTNNVIVRDAGRQLGEVRDCAVLLERLDSLNENYAEQLSEEAFISIRTNLEQQRSKLLKRLLEDGENTIEQLLDTLKTTKDGITEWEINSEDFDAFYSSLRRVYLRGHSAMKKAQSKPTSENLHQWRKRVKYLFYQLGFLRPIWPEILKSLEESLGKLADLLGEDHDLAVLESSLNENSGGFRDDKEKQVLLGLIAQQRAKLQERAWPLGSRIYHENPRRFTSRMEAYWKAMEEEAGL